MTLEAHYPLTEDTGNVALDYSGNGFNGTLNGGAGPSGTGTVTGPFGNSAYSFDESDDYIDTPFSTNLSSFSACIWVNVTDLNSDIEYILSRWENDTFDRSWALRIDANDNYQITMHDSNDNVYSVTQSASTNQWDHLIGLRDSDGTLRLYVNGVETGSDSSPNIKDSTTNLHIGSSSDADTANLFGAGSLSGARVYSRALSPQEVQALYQAGERSEAVFGVTDSTATARSVSGGGAGGGFYGGGGGGGGSSGGGGGGTTY